MFCKDILSLNQNCSGINSCKTNAPTINPTSKPTLTPTVQTFALSPVTLKPTTIDVKDEGNSTSLLFMGISVILILLALVIN